MKKKFSDIKMFEDLKYVNEEVARFKVQQVKNEFMKRDKGANKNEQDKITTIFK